MEAMIGTTMIARMIPAASMPRPYGVPAEQSSPAQGLAEKWLNVHAQQRRQNEDAPQAVDHAGNCSEKLNQEGNDGAQ